MSFAHDIVFDPAGISLLAEITQDALSEAKRLGVPVPSNDREARQLLAKRIIRAIEAGETDMPKLRDIALMPTLA
jgi:hypothetical protein